MRKVTSGVQSWIKLSYAHKNTCSDGKRRGTLENESSNYDECAEYNNLKTKSAAYD